jgi:hypothetical protein
VQIRQLFRRCDVDGTHTVDYREFIEYMLEVRPNLLVRLLKLSLASAVCNESVTWLRFKDSHMIQPVIWCGLNQCARSQGDPGKMTKKKPEKVDPLDVDSSEDDDDDDDVVVAEPKSPGGPSRHEVRAR